MSMLDQLIPMLGVLVGSLTTYLGASLAERARFKRALATRWDESKLETYSEYAGTVKDMLRAAKRYADAQDAGHELTALGAELEAADNLRSRVFERVVLLGDSAVTSAGRDANRLVLEAKRSCLDPEKPVGLDLGGDQVVDALNALHEAARKDLGIASLPWQRTALPESSA